MTIKKGNKYLLGIDLGGTQLRFILADSSTGDISFTFIGRDSKITFDSPLCGKSDIFDNAGLTDIPDSEKISAYIVLKLREYLDYAGIKTEDIRGIGISVAGRIMSDKRFIGSNVPLRYAVKKGNYYGVDLLGGLKRIFPENVPIAIENDANCSGLAQAIYYKHMGIEPYTTFYVTVSTGIGGGGPKRDIDEVGHIIVDGYFPRLVPSCGCGAKGCIEAYASGEGIRNQALNILNVFENDRITFKQLCAFEHLRSDQRVDLQHLLQTSELYRLYKAGENISPKMIFGLANINSESSTFDHFAHYLVDIAAERFAKVLVSISNIHGIERFGLGGSVILNNPWYTEIIRSKIAQIYELSIDIFRHDLIVEVSPLGWYAADYGALFLVVNPADEDAWIQTINRLS